jgi:hypothetical protein
MLRSGESKRVRVDSVLLDVSSEPLKSVRRSGMTVLNGRGCEAIRTWLSLRRYSRITSWGLLGRRSRELLRQVTLVDMVRAGGGDGLSSMIRELCRAGLLSILLYEWVRITSGGGHTSSEICSVLALTVGRKGSTSGGGQASPYLEARRGLSEETCTLASPAHSLGEFWSRCSTPNPSRVWLDFSRMIRGRLAGCLVT